MEAVDFRIWKKGKLPAKQQLLILLLAGILLVVVVSPVRIRKIRKSGQGRDRKKRKQKGERRQNNSMKDCWKKGGRYPGMRGGSRESKGDAHLEIFGREVVEKDSQREENEITEEDSKGGSRVSEDRSLSHTSIYEQKSDGTQTPYVSKEMAPEIEGMVIAADGGDDPVVVKI